MEAAADAATASSGGGCHKEETNSGLCVGEDQPRQQDDSWRTQLSQLSSVRPLPVVLRRGPADVPPEELYRAPWLPCAPPAGGAVREVAIKVLPLPGDGTRAHLRSCALVRRLQAGAGASGNVAAQSANFVVELEALVEIPDWPEAKRLYFLPCAEAGGACSAQRPKEDDHKRRRAGNDGDDDIDGGNDEPMGCCRSSAIAILMPYYEESLLEYIERRKRQRVGGDSGLSLGEALVLLKQMATAIWHCHSQAICHRGSFSHALRWKLQRRKLIT